MFSITSDQVLPTAAAVSNQNKYRELVIIFNAGPRKTG